MRSDEVGGVPQGGQGWGCTGARTEKGEASAVLFVPPVPWGDAVELAPALGAGSPRGGAGENRVSPAPARRSAVVVRRRVPCPACVRGQRLLLATGRGSGQGTARRWTGT